MEYGGHQNDKISVQKRVSSVGRTTSTPSSSSSLFASKLYHFAEPFILRWVLALCKRCDGHRLIM
jgi:hypothetical protein